MRPRFEKDLRSFGQVAKEELEIDQPSKTELDQLSSVVDWHLKRAAENQHTNILKQREIYDIQKEKQKIMNRFKELLTCLDDPKCHQEKREKDRFTKFDKEKNGFIYKDGNGKEQIATLGEIITDMDWGVTYYLDKKSVSRQVTKKYLLERAKYALNDLLDSQIIKSEVAGDITHEYKKLAYEAIKKERQNGGNLSGFVAEKIVKNLLKKMTFDEGLPFEIIEADVFQDVEQKIDFIIRRKEKVRGVGVEAGDKVHDIGIQFSINPNAEEKKKYQVERSKSRLTKEDRIDDIVLVIFPIQTVNHLRHEWNRNGKQSGGPDKLLDKKTAEKIFKNLLKNIFTDEEIETYWEKVSGKFLEVVASSLAEQV